MRRSEFRFDVLFDRLAIALLFTLAILSVGRLEGQQTNVVIQPDVSFNFGPLTATGTVQISNAATSLGIRYWNFEYSSTGFSIVSVTLQGAPDSSGSPGSWSTYPGLVYLGTNPSTSITGAIMGLSGTVSNLNPWVRINATLTGTGSLTGRVYGYRNFPGCPSPCPSGQGGGGTPVVPTFGTSFVAISLSSSGLTQIIAAPSVASQSIRLTYLDGSLSAASNYTLEYGTGTNCGVGTTAISGVYQTILTVVQNWGQDPLIVPAGNALCINLGTSVTWGGLAKYAIF